MISLSNGQAFHDFTYVGSDTSVNPYSRTKIDLKCRCGKTKSVQVANVTNGSTRTCNGCNDMTLVAGARLGSFIYAGGDITVGPKSGKKLPFTCRCGRTKTFKVANVSNGNTKTCNECDNVIIRRGSSYGDLTYFGPPVDIGPGSHRELPFSCRCGRTKNIQMQYVLLGGVRSCGMCDFVTLTTGDEYRGFTYIGPSCEAASHSNKKYEFRCRCGGTKAISLHNVTDGITKSCGNCRKGVYDWHIRNEAELRLSSSFTIKGFPPGGIVPNEPVLNASKPFSATCPSCLSNYRPRLKDIRRGLSLTCGCTGGSTSSLSFFMADFLKSESVDFELEYVVEGRKFDVFLPGKNLLIEVNGLRWHSMDGARERDASKYKIAKGHGFSFMSFFEDEVCEKPEIVRNILRNRIGTSRSTSLRPSSCEIATVRSSDVTDLYDSHHYIGRCNSRFNYAITHEGKIIGCMSFRLPSRQNCKHEYEVSRMVMDPKFRVHGIWSKILKSFVREHNPRSVVTYSDNRLFEGSVYGRIGFSYDGDVSSDYYWVKGKNRYHKSGFRKPESCDVAESVLRTSEGYSKIWDLGKKRWILKCKGHDV